MGGGDGGWWVRGKQHGGRQEVRVGSGKQGETMGCGEGGRLERENSGEEGRKEKQWKIR